MAGINDYSNTAGSNTTINGIDIAEGCSPAGINNAIRQLMADIADMDDGVVPLQTPDINGGTIDGAVIGGTTPAAGTFTTITTTGDINFGDNDKAVFGAGSDLQIYHDGSNSYVSDVGTGNLRLTTTGVSIEMKSSGEDMAKFFPNGSVDLYYDNVKKFETTSTGIDVTGTVVSDGLGVGTSSLGTYVSAMDSGTAGNTNAEAGLYLNGTRAGVVYNIVSNTANTTTDKGSGIKFQNGGFDTGAIIIRNDGASVSGDSAGYMTFHTSDDGTENLSERMRIDSSGNVGIGTSSPTGGKLHIAHGNELGIYTSGPYNFQAKFESTDSEAAIVIEDSNSTNDGNRIGVVGDDMLFITANSEAMRINSSGFAKFTTTGSYDTYSGADDSHQFVSDNNGHSTLWITNQNASYSGLGVLRVETNRGPNSGFVFLTTTTGNLTDDQHRLRGDGQAYADGSWNGGGADYAEYFEWADGNTSNEDRVGYSVVLEGDKIRKATDTDNSSNIIGVISGNPFVVGDTSWNKWNEKYLRDDFGRYILEEYTVTEWEEEITEDEITKTIKKSFETDKIPSDEIVPNDATIISQETNGDNLKRRKLNPDYDESLEYIPREDRKEWSTVGLLGKLRIRKGQPVGDRWIKMRDISDTVEEWLIK